MINFLKETIDALAAIGRTPEDVISIGDSKYRIDWDTFAANADFEYDDGFGAPYICGHTEEKGCDFVVYGIGFVMYRHEYDGAEYWYSIEIPDDVSPNIKPKRVRFQGSWDSHFRWQFERDKKIRRRNMGLDAYFYIDHSEKRRVKLKAEIDNVDVSKTLKSVESLLTADTETSKRLAYAFDKFIEHFGDGAAKELKNVLRDTMHDESIEVEPESINMEEAMYFRAFWFLNKYFNYTNEWYAKDMPVTKKQIEELKSLCDKARAELRKAKTNDTHSDQASLLVSKVFSYDLLPYHVDELHKLCVTLLKDVDWDTDKVYYEADW